MVEPRESGCGIRRAHVAAGTGGFDDDGRLDFAVMNDVADYVSVFLTR